MGRKKLEELTILDNFMFSAAMITDPENCRRVLECALGMAIDRVEVVHEKTMVYHPEFKGIRLDVYAKEMMERILYFLVPRELMMVRYLILL